MPLHRHIAQKSTDHLGIPTGIEGSSFALTKLRARKSEPGYLVAEKSFSEWRFLGLARADGETLMYGPDVNQHPAWFADAVSVIQGQINLELNTSHGSN